MCIVQLIWICEYAFSMNMHVGADVGDLLLARSVKEGY